MIDYSILKANQTQPLSWWYDPVTEDQPSLTKKQVIEFFVVRQKLKSLIAATGQDAGAFRYLIANLDPIDCTLAEVRALVNGMVTANVITAADRDALIALAKKSTPRWQVLGCTVGPQQGDLDWVAAH